MVFPYLSAEAELAYWHQQIDDSRRSVTPVIAPMPDWSVVFREMRHLVVAAARRIRHV